MLQVDVLRQLYPAAPEGVIQAVADQHLVLFDEFGIADSQNRLHFFLAQVGHESGLQPIEEKLGYSAERLMQVWPKRFPTLASTQGFAKNAKALANKVYGGRMGNDPNTDDGWNYRGRGFIQITGKDGYARVGDAAGLDLVGKPELATDVQAALRVACGFWSWKKLNPQCDAGKFIKVTELINGGQVGLQDRFKWLEKVQSAVSWPLTGAAGALAAPQEVALTVVQLKAVQLKLQALGLYQGSIDGAFGKLSRDGLKIFQAEHNLKANGKLTQETVLALGV